MKKLFVFEIDNVLTKLDEALLDMAKNNFTAFPDRKTGEVSNFFRESIENPNIYYGLKPIQPMINMMLDLQASGYPVGVFSARPESSLNFTKKWIKKHLGAELSFVYCGVFDKCNFLYDIRDSLQFVVDSDIGNISAMKAEGFPVLAYLEHSFQGIEINPCLYSRMDETIMLWQKADEEAVPLFEYLNELDEE